MTGRPAMSQADEEQIWSIYEETRNRKEVARRTGFHYNTVLKVIAVRERLCVRCRDPLPPQENHVRCPKCRAAVTANARRYTKERRRLGLCQQCNNPVEPPSLTRCAVHRLRDNERGVGYKATARASARLVNGGTPTEEQKERELRWRYGAEAVEVWREREGRCELCGKHHTEIAIHLHHIDKDHANRQRENFACLCQACHRLVHLLSEHPDPLRALAWIRKTYPNLSV